MVYASAHLESLMTMNERSNKWETNVVEQGIHILSSRNSSFPTPFTKVQSPDATASFTNERTTHSVFAQVQSNDVSTR